MLGNPIRGEAVNFSEAIGELSRDVALDPAADQRDVEVHCCREVQP